MNDQVIKNMKNAMAATVQYTIAEVGLIPEECSDLIKAVLQDPTKDTPVTIALGCALQDCQKQKNYEPLKKFQKQVDERKQKESKRKAGES